MTQAVTEWQAFKANNCHQGHFPLLFRGASVIEARPIAGASPFIALDFVKESWRRPSLRLANDQH